MLEQDGGVYSRRVPKVQLDGRISDNEAPVLEPFLGPWDGGGLPEGLGRAGQGGFTFGPALHSWRWGPLSES